MAGQTLANADAALKDVYQDGVRNQLNDEIPFLASIEGGPQGNGRDYTNIDLEGRQAILSLRTGRNSGVGSRGDGGTLPTAGNQGYVVEKVGLKYHYGRGQITGPTIRAMKSARGSFVRAVDSEMKGITSDLKREISRQLWGNADAKIATCTTTTNSTTVLLNTGTTAVQMRFFQVGDKVDIGTAANPTLRVAGAKITGFNTATPSITIDSAITTAGTDFVFRAGNNDAGTVRELTGIQAQIKDTGALFNVDPATNPVWASRVDATIGSLSENAMAKTVQNVRIASGEDVKFGVCSDGVHRAYSNLLTTLKRSVNTTDLKGGYSGLSFSAAGPEMQVVWDRDCPSQDLFWVNPAHFAEYRMADWEFMQEDGNVLSRVPGVDAYEFTLFMYSEIATDQRNSHGLMSGITEA